MPRSPHRSKSRSPPRHSHNNNRSYRSRSPSPSRNHDNRRYNSYDDNRRYNDKRKRSPSRDRDRTRYRSRERERDNERDNNRDRERERERKEKERDDRNKRDSSSQNNEFKQFQQVIHNTSNNSTTNTPANNSSNNISSSGSNSTSTKPNPSSIQDKLSHISIPSSMREEAQRIREAELAASQKPQFLSKKQREEAALKRLEEQRMKEQQQTNKILSEIQSKTQHQNSSSNRMDTSSDSRSHQSHNSSHNSNNGKVNSVNNSNNNKINNSNDNMNDPAELVDRHELEHMKKVYLGLIKPEKKELSLAIFGRNKNKPRFVEEWNPKEDTSVDTNELYSQRHQAAPLFGRGYVGGVDRQVQKSEFYDQLVQDRAHNINTDHDGSNTESAVLDSNYMDKIKQREERAKQRESDYLQQNRHWSRKSLLEMREKDWRILREDFEIHVRGNNAVPHPIRYWAESGLPIEILNTLENIGYKEPSKIQRQAIPVGLRNLDCVGISETGSGKTASFVIPMLVFLMKLPKLTPALAEDGPYSLVLAPTRELAQQIETETNKFAKPLDIRCTSIVGGLSIEEQGFVLRNGVEVVIGTPGRVVDCIEKRYLVLHQCNYVVLDEADAMIDMNFEADLRKILDSMPSSNLRPLDEAKDVNSNNIEDNNNTTMNDTLDSSGNEFQQKYRQTIMFSATMPAAVGEIAKKYLRNPVYITIGERKGQAAVTVTQRVEWMANEVAKKKRLIEIIRTETAPFIVFCNQRKTCDFISKELENNSIRCIVLHGAKQQEIRSENLAKFKNNEVPVLVATDVAGRGIDITGVEQVINYELPSNIERYTHRIGRVGRAGRKGIATSFLTPQDKLLMYELRQFLINSNQVVPAELDRQPESKTLPSSNKTDGLVMITNKEHFFD